MSNHKRLSLKYHGFDLFSLVYTARRQQLPQLNIEYIIYKIYIVL